MIFSQKHRLGARCLPGGSCRFEVWAPRARRVELHLVAPDDRLLAMDPAERGYFTLEVPGLAPGARYLLRLDGDKELPDPASRSQPEGVHGPSQVVGPLQPVSSLRQPAKNDEWRGLPLQEYVFYEIQVGTFTPEGTFAAVLPRLPELKDLGVTAVEIMPVGQFPGTRNWGYDGVYPFAAQDSYGGILELRRLVEACHDLELAAVLDVVYNHLGPEGNYLSEFGPYFTPLYRTPWGEAVNLDGEGSDEVRRYFIENALWWTTEVGFDALRLDALHALVDRSARPFLAELATEIHAAAGQAGRRIYLIAESDANDPRLLLPPERGGYGLDAQWNDDFHHALHVLLTGERAGYYQSFGSMEQLSLAYQEGFVYSGQYSPYRKRRHGSSSRALPATRFVVYSQNHDQVGNRRLGERLSRLAGFEALKLAAAAVILSPFLPLIFMGEEYGEPAPFLYFTSHSDLALAAAVQESRQQGFLDLAPGGEAPAPQQEATFARSRLNWDLRQEGQHATLLSFYRKLLQLRRDLPALRLVDKDSQEVGFSEEERIITLKRRGGGEGDEVFLALHLADRPASRPIILPPGEWLKELDSAEERWLGRGSEAPWVLSSSSGHLITLPPYGVLLFRRRTDV